MTFWIGVALFAVGILVSICLHEAGHLLTAKRFGMKATQYFAGFGPTLWSFRRGETEYGLKAIPAGGFVKIVGMTPEEEVAPEDRKRAFWRWPTWKRTVVLGAGSFTHFVLALLIFAGMAVTTGLPNPAWANFSAEEAAPVIGEVSECVIPEWDVDGRGRLRDCRPDDPEAPAAAAGLRKGDVFVSVGDKRTRTYGEVVDVIQNSEPGPVELTYRRDGRVRTTTVDLVAVERPKIDKDGNLVGTPSNPRLETISMIGVVVDSPQPVLDYDAGSAPGAAVWFLGKSVEQTFGAIARFPSKIPKLFEALSGGERDAETPVSVVGASRIGGEAVAIGAPIIFLALLGGLNVFIGIFNLFPLLPLDGGHIAVIWFERARSWVAARLGRPDPGRVDYAKLMPVTYVVILAFGGITLLTLAADIVNPIRLS